MALLEGGESGSTDGAPKPRKQCLRSFTDGAGLCLPESSLGDRSCPPGDFIPGRTRQ